MDSREIVTFKELNRLAISLQTTNSDIRDRVRDGRRINIMVVLRVETHLAHAFSLKIDAGKKKLQATVAIL